MYIYSFNRRVPEACQNALSKLELCIAELSNWMTVNKLKLNHSKTEFFIAGTIQGLKKKKKKKKKEKRTPTRRIQSWQ